MYATNVGRKKKRKITVLPKYFNSESETNNPVGTIYLILK